MYQLIIHHDIGILGKEGNLEIDNKSPGHVYLELKKNDDSIVYGVLSGVDLDLNDLTETYNSYQKYIIHGKGRLELAREYDHQNPNNKVLHSKTIEITEEQYLKGKMLLDKYEQYLGQEIPSEIYGLFGNNCAHFVNHIYRSMGLEGDYTRNYREYELNRINTKLTNAYKAVFGLYAGDKPFTVFGSSIEEIAKKYNIDTSKIVKKEPIQGIPDMDTIMIQDLSSKLMFDIVPNAELDLYKQVQQSVLEEVGEVSKAAIINLSTEKQWELNSSFRQQVMHTIFSPSEKQFAQMEELLAQGANINGGEEFLGKDAYLCCFGYPAPLLLAAKSSEAKVVEFLLSKGANPNITDNRSTIRLFSPALHYAIYDNNLEIVKLLVKANADVNLRDKSTKIGQTPLELALRRAGVEYQNTGDYIDRIEILKILSAASSKLQESNLELLGKENDILEEAKSDSELKDQAVIVNCSNKVINHLAGKFLSDQNYSKEYTEESINDALSGLKLTKNIIPGITAQSLKFANEHYESMQQLTGIKYQSEELEKIKKYKQKSEQIKQEMGGLTNKQSYNNQAQEKTSNDQDWLNDILSHTQTAMNEAYHDPEMQQFMKDLGGNSGFNYDDFS